jgi:hypothetical protein
MGEKVPQPAEKRKARFGASKRAFAFFGLSSLRDLLELGQQLLHGLLEGVELLVQGVRGLPSNFWSSVASVTAR